MIRIVIVLYAHTVAMRIMWSVVSQELHLATYPDWDTTRQREVGPKSDWRT